MAIISTIAANAVDASNDGEVRGQVTDISVPVFTWNTLNFPGFFYDVDENTDTITMDNKDYRILLNKNKDMVLMQNIHIKTETRIPSMIPIRLGITSTR